MTTVVVSSRWAKSLTMSSVHFLAAQEIMFVGEQLRLRLHDETRHRFDDPDSQVSGYSIGPTWSSIMEEKIR